MLRIIALILFSVISHSLQANENNYLNLDLESLLFTLPENNSGKAGELIFSKAKLNWNDMRVSLKNTDQALNADLTLRPNLINFKTHRLNLTLPLSEDSPVFAIRAAELKTSNIMVNKEFFNFTGELFKIQNEAAIVTLDQFNSLCVGRDIDNLTTIDGLIAGCLNDFIINGKNEGDLAGAKLEYTDKIDDMDIYFASRLKDLKLKHNKFALDLDNANLNAANYDVQIGKSIMSCDKDPELFEIDFEKIKSDCVDSFTVDSPSIQIKDLKSTTEYDVKLENLDTKADEVHAKLKTVTIKDEGKKTVLSDLQLICKKQAGDEFYELKKVVAGCVIDSRLRLEKAQYGRFQALYGDAYIKNGKLDFKIWLKIPYVPKNIPVTITANVSHDYDKNHLLFKLKTVQFAGIPSWRRGLNYLLDFFVGMDNLEFTGKKVIIKL